MKITVKLAIKKDPECNFLDIQRLIFEIIGD